MKQQMKPLAVSLCLLGIISTPALAMTDSQAKKLMEEVSQLKQQVSALEAQSGTEHPKKKTALSKSYKKSGGFVATDRESVVDTEGSNGGPGSVANLPTTGATYLPVDVAVPGQSFVSSGPYIGIPLQFSGSNLIINSPSVNQDVALLKVRKNVRQRLEALGVADADDHAHILLSGIVEGQGIYKNMGGNTPDSSDIDLTNVTLDAYILGPSQWLSSLISMQYDNDLGTNSGSFASYSRPLNSRVFIRQAFVTIGNFTQSPFYGTFGQMFVPFGTYSSSMVSSPLTQSLFRTKARAILLGIQPQKDNAFYASGYIFKGDSHVGSTSRVNNGGINFGYHFQHNVITSDVGGGAILNVADATGMQDVGNSTGNFNGFGGITTGSGLHTGNERIVHRVAGYEARALLGIGDNINLLGEYITSASTFSQSDLMYQNHGAKPQALNAEAAYTFTTFARPSSVAVGYAMTKDALALELPAKRYSVVFNTSIWKDTLQSLELRHDINYSASAVASGSGLMAPSASGKADNIVTAQFDVYF